jgi:thiamine-monophosphate kinase
VHVDRRNSPQSAIPPFRVDHDVLTSSCTSVILNAVPTEPKPRTPPGELALIERIRTRASTLHSTRLRLGIGDDCAILSPPPNHDLLVTTDFSLEGRHFRRDWHSPQSIGHRTLARGLSDLAAMGATPLACFLSLALPKSIARTPVWLEAFFDGLLSLANFHKVPLAGGDTSESPTDHILADVTLLGTAPKSKALRRSGAHPGDLLYVTGALGGSATELAQLSGSPRRFSKASSAGSHPHLFPQPRVAVGQALLRRQLVTACIDISDGLSTDLAHLCTASHVAAEIDISRLPAHQLTLNLTDAKQINSILHGGEDYELLFTVSPSTKVPRSIAGVPITCIGSIIKPQKNRPQMSIVDPASGSQNSRFELQPQGWEHLR